MSAQYCLQAEGDIDAPIFIKFNILFRFYIFFTINGRAYTRIKFDHVDSLYFVSTENQTIYEYKISRGIVARNRFCSRLLKNFPIVIGHDD